MIEKNLSVLFQVPGGGVTELPSINWSFVTNFRAYIPSLPSVRGGGIISSHSRKDEELQVYCLCLNPVFSAAFSFICTSVSDPDWIRIQMGLWIRIRIGNPDPDPDPDPVRPKWSPKKEKKRNFMFEEHSFGLEAFPEACTSFLGV